VRGLANDAMLLRALLFRKTEAKHLIATYALSAVSRTGPLLPTYVTRWFRVAAAPNGLPGTNYYADWLAYQAEPDPVQAAHFLERCVTQPAWMDEDARDMLVAEAAVFTALRRGNPEKAESWFKRVKSFHRLHPIGRARTEVAVLCARQRMQEACSAAE